MIHSDKNDFKDLFDGLADYYRIDHLSQMALKIYFGALDKFSIDQLNTAASKHVANTKSGQFFPKAADLIRHLEGGEITVDILVASAKLKNSPLGIMARIHIGSWDIDNQDGFYLRQRATECLLLLPEWKARAEQGEYTDHEISIMIKHGVDPLAPFSNGLAAPQNAPELIERVTAIKGTKRHAELLEDTKHDESTAPMHPCVAAFLESETK